MNEPKVFVTTSSTGGLVFLSRLPETEAQALYTELLTDVDPRSNTTEEILYKMLCALRSDHYVNLYAFSRTYDEVPQHFAEAASELYVMLDIGNHTAI